MSFDVDALVEATRTMRQAQRAYYADPKRSAGRLATAKRCERDVDRLLVEHDRATRQLALPMGDES